MPDSPVLFRRMDDSLVFDTKDDIYSVKPDMLRTHACMSAIVCIHKRLEDLEVGHSEAVAPIQNQLLENPEILPEVLD